MRLEPVQGQDDKGRDFGYVHGEDGGFFFTWLETLGATVSSAEEDTVDGDGGLDRSDVVEFLCRRLPGTPKGRMLWTEA